MGLSAQLLRRSPGVAGVASRIGIGGHAVRRLIGALCEGQQLNAGG